MDTVTSATRSTARPTQEYYIPRKLLECGRGPTTISSPQKNCASSQKREDSKSPRETNNNKGGATGKEEARNGRRPDQSSRNNKSAKQHSPPTSEKTYSPKEKTTRIKVEPIIQHLNKLTVSEPRIVNTKANTLQRPNAFCPTPTHNDGCICERPKTHVMCKRCSYECTGRVVRICSSHPKKLDLLDLRECPNTLCKSIQILEINQENNTTG